MLRGGRFIESDVSKLLMNMDLYDRVEVLAKYIIGSSCQKEVARVISGYLAPDREGNV